MVRSTGRNLEQLFRIRGKRNDQRTVMTKIFTLEELMNYAIERGYTILSIDRGVMVNGLNDKMLFENDLVIWEHNYYDEKLLGKIQWNKTHWHISTVNNPEISEGVKHSEFYTQGKNCSKQNFAWGELEQIGNIHTSPELIPESQSFLKE